MDRTFGDQSIKLSKGPYVRFEGTSMSLNVAGQILAGDFSFEKNSDGKVEVNFVNGKAVIGPESKPYMDVSNASGLFEIDSQGMSGIFKVDGLIINVPNVEFDLNAALFEINTRPTEYNGTANLGDASEIFSLEAGPYFRSVYWVLK